MALSTNEKLDRIANALSAVCDALYSLVQTNNSPYGWVEKVKPDLEDAKMMLDWEKRGRGSTNALGDGNVSR